MKRLYRSEDRVLAGVCGGVAEYFGLEPTLVRVVWTVATVCLGFGGLLYLLMWVLTPEEY